MVNFFNLPKDSLGKGIISLCTYMHVMNKKNNNISAIKSHEWDKFHHLYINWLYYQKFVNDNTNTKATATRSTSTAITLLKLTITATGYSIINHSLLVLNKIQTTNFIRNTNLTLNNRISIMQFYCNIFTQGFQYNIFVNNINVVDQLTNIALYTLLPPAKLIIKQTLHKKFRQDTTIHSSFAIAKALLQLTNNGIFFLEKLLLIIYPQFMNVNVIMKNIPKFLTYNDLYTYTNSIQENKNFKISMDVPILMWNYSLCFYNISTMIYIRRPLNQQHKNLKVFK